MSTATEGGGRAPEPTRADGGFRVLWTLMVAGFVVCAAPNLAGGRALGAASGGPVAGLIAFGGAAVVAVRSRRGSPTTSSPLTPWVMLSAGLALFVAGTAIAGTNAHHTRVVVGAGVISLCGYPWVTLGLRRLLAERVPRVVDALVEAGLIAVASGLALWVSLAGPNGGFGAHPVGVALVDIALCALDVGVLALACRLLVYPGVCVRSDRLLCAGFASLLLMHAAVTLTSLEHLGHRSVPVTLLLTVALGFWGLAAADPKVHRRADRDFLDGGGFSRCHAAFVAVCLLVAPTVIGVQAHRHAIVSPAIAVGAGLLELVMAAYVTSLLWDRAVTEHQAQHDHLTLLPNAMLFRDRVQRAVSHARRSNGSVAVMFLDLDHFKHVNDSLGHAAGDDVLRQVARRLVGCLREEDTVARLGGDEFAILLPYLDSFEGAVVVAEKLMKAFHKQFTLEGQSWHLTPSVGIALFPNDGGSAEELVVHADAAMYRVKEGGRNGYEVFTARLHARAQERVELEAALYNGIERAELTVHYQPKVDLRTRMIVGAEALVRWQHPERGLVSPAEFIPLAEQTGQIVRLGEVVMFEACRQAKKWQDEGLPAIPIAVNVSVPQFKAGIADLSASVLRRTGLDPSCLEVELTESAAAEGLEVIATALEELRSMGVRCSIDDFGTGYCSLSYLSRLPIDALKIDKSFIDLMANERDGAIVDAVISMAHRLKLKVVAEGVETEQQWQALAEFGCDQVQGYLISRPVPATDFGRLLQAQADATLPPRSTLPPQDSRELAARRFDPGSGAAAPQLTR